MDEKKHAHLTGGSAQIDFNVGGMFSDNEGYSPGTDLEVVQDATIVQTWRAGDWLEDHYSSLTITLTQVSSKTGLSFVQTRSSI